MSPELSGPELKLISPGSFDGLAIQEFSTEKSLLDSMLERINAHLAPASLIGTQGSTSIVDATVIKTRQSRPKKNKKGEHTQDPEMAYTS